MTAAESVLAVMGPNSRKLLQMVSPNDFSNEVNPFGTSQDIEIGMGLARVNRVTYVGELGWGVYVSNDQAAHVFETLHKAGQELDLKLCGLHMMDSCRIEKGYRHFGHDITSEDHILEAGLGFACKTDKPDFIGKTALEKVRDLGITRKMSGVFMDGDMFKKNNEHRWSVSLDSEKVGEVTSAVYSPRLNRNIGFALLDIPHTKVGTMLQVETAEGQRSLEVTTMPFIDPDKSIPRRSLRDDG